MAESRRKTNRLVPPDSDGRKQIKLHTKLIGNTATQEAVFLPACIFSHPDFFPAFVLPEQDESLFYFLNYSMQNFFPYLIVFWKIYINI